MEDDIQHPSSLLTVLIKEEPSDDFSYLPPPPSVERAFPSYLPPPPSVERAFPAYLPPPPLVHVKLEPLCQLEDLPHIKTEVKVEPREHEEFSAPYDAPTHIERRVVAPNGENSAPTRGNEGAEAAPSAVRGEHECWECGDEFKSAMGLKIHRTKVHGESAGAGDAEVGAAPGAGTARASVVLVDGHKVLVCSTCDKTFPSRKKLRDHVTCAHPAPHRAAPCPHCGKSFKTSVNLKVHVRLVHNATPSAPCTRCGKTFKTELLLQKHMAWSHPEDGRLFPCSLCPRVLKSSVAYAKHIENVHPPAGAITRCPEPTCGRLFKSPFHLRQHHKRFHLKLRYSASSHHRPVSITTPALGTELVRDAAVDGATCATTDAATDAATCAATGVMIDNATHASTSAVIDGATYTTTNTVTDTVTYTTTNTVTDPATYAITNDVTDDETYAMTNAVTDTASYTTLDTVTDAPVSGENNGNATRTEETTCESVQEERHRERYNCSLCPRSYASVPALEWHHTLEHPEGLVSNACNICGRLLPDKASLKRHVRSVHADGTEQHACPLCGKMYKSQLSLQQHVRVTHAPPDAAVACQLCGKLLKCRAHLHVHMRTVHGEPGDYECTACGKHFTRPKYLERHVRSHGDKTHRCHLCHKLFKSDEDARRHVRRVHSGLPPAPRHRCGACDRELSTVYTLRAHMTAVHGATSVECAHAACRVGFPSLADLAEHERLHYALEVKFEPPDAEE